MSKQLTRRGVLKSGAVVGGVSERARTFIERV